MNYPSFIPNAVILALAEWDAMNRHLLDEARANRKDAAARPSSALMPRTARTSAPTQSVHRAWAAAAVALKRQLLAAEITREQYDARLREMLPLWKQAIAAAKIFAGAQRFADELTHKGGK